VNPYRYALIRGNAFRYNSYMSDSTVISAAVPAVVRDQLAKLAAAHDRSLSAELRRAASLYLRVESRSEDDR